MYTLLSRSVVSDSSRPRGLQLPVSSVHGISQRRIWVWLAISSSCWWGAKGVGVFPTQGWNPSFVSPALTRRFFYYCTMWEAHSTELLAPILTLSPSFFGTGFSSVSICSFFVFFFPKCQTLSPRSNKQYSLETTGLSRAEGCWVTHGQVQNTCFLRKLYLGHFMFIYFK